MLEPEIDHDFIRAYAEGLLNEADAGKARALIQQSRDAYEFYVSLKEASFLSRSGWDVSEKEIQDVFRNLKQSHSDIFVRFSGDQVMVSQSSMDEPGYSGIHSSFSGGRSRTGPVTIARSLDGREIKITLTPLPEGREVILTITGFAGSARVLQEGKLFDGIEDLSVMSRFAKRLSCRGKYEILLRDPDGNPYSIGLVLESD